MPQLQVVIDPGLPPIVEGAVSFETGAQETGTLVYGPGQVGPLAAFFEDLISGRPMPLTFAMHRVSGAHSVVAAALFLRRDLALNPLAPGLVYAVDLDYRLGDSMLAHAPPELSRFIRGVKSYFPSNLSKREQGERLSTAIQWVAEYLTHGALPNLGPQPEAVEILDVGTNGFVLARGNPSVEGWETLYRNGYLKGAIVSQSDGDYRQVLLARKSFGVGFDLERATTILNELENLSGSLPGWRLLGNYLYSPYPEGSTILLAYLTEVLVRI